MSDDSDSENSISSVETETEEQISNYPHSTLFESNDRNFNFKNTDSIKKIVKKCKPYGWEKVFEESYSELKVISDKLETLEKKSGRIVPDRNLIFRAFHICPLENVRVVIIGQDPYQNLDDNGNSISQGTSFSVKKGQPIPPSLKNIFKEIKNCYKDCKVGEHGCLEKWSKEGVLLLNTCLTTDVGVSNAHGKYALWMPFIIDVIDAIAETNPKCIYVLWGKEAQKIKPYLKKNPIIIETSHPSPFSVNYGFDGSKCFKKINKHLDAKKLPELAKGKEHHWSVLKGPIDWSLDD